MKVLVTGGTNGMGKGVAKVLAYFVVLYNHYRGLEVFGAVIYELYPIFDVISICALRTSLQTFVGSLKQESIKKD